MVDVHRIARALSTISPSDCVRSVRLTSIACVEDSACVDLP